MRLLSIALVAAAAAACAARVPPMPPEPAAPKYPSYVFPGAPAPADLALRDHLLRGWRFLQTGDLRTAEREFAGALRMQPQSGPAETGLGYVALARGQVPLALDRFGRALASRGDYAPALVGRAEALLSLDRYAEALESLSAAAAADPSLDLASRMQVLRLRVVQDRVATARLALERGDSAEARTNYLAAIEASPESGFLYRELALTERRDGRLDAAIDHFRRAIELDPSDARAHAGLAEALDASGDPDGALKAYEAAWALEPSPTLDARINELRKRIAARSLPPEYQQIERSTTITRGELAALLGVRLADWLEAAHPQPRLITDAHEHWAAAFITKAVQAGVMEPFPNHTFQPDLEIRRGDLARVVSRVLDLVGRVRPSAASARRSSRPEISDVPRSHLAYPDVAQAVGAGVLDLRAGAFQPGRPVSGSEAAAAIERLRSIAGSAPLSTLPAVTP